MKAYPIGFVLAIFVTAAALGSAQTSRPAATGCNSPDGSRFNLEPRLNAVVQAAESVALLPNRAGANVDLVVATGNDARGLSTNPNATIISADAFYVQRSNASCAADFEGGLPSIANMIDLFIPFGHPTVVADPARDAFFIADLRFGITHDNNGVGIVRTTAKTLLDPNTCPNGTEIGTASCWTTGAVTNITTLNAFLFNPQIVVDLRPAGTGAGDIYTVVSQADPNNTLHTGIFLTACTNGLNCGNSVKVSGADLEGDFGWVQVRPDGSITVSYRNTSFPGVNPETIKFVNCKPQGAPAAPMCGAPVVITTERNPVFASNEGDAPTLNTLYPKHAHRLELDGKSVTTFLVYDRCDTAVRKIGVGSFVCPKSDVVLTSSSDGGTTWSQVTNIANSSGQQFFANIAADTSTGTVNIAYYSTERDPFGERPQIFLAQVLPGVTTVGPPQLLTSAAADMQASSPILLQFQATGFGDRLGLAASGTGITGQSRAYVSFTWNSVLGTYSGVSSTDVNNHLTLLQY